MKVHHSLTVCQVVNGGALYLQAWSFREAYRWSGHTRLLDSTTLSMVSPSLHSEVPFVEHTGGALPPEDSRSRKPTGMRVHIFFLMGSFLSNFVIVKRASICMQTPHENITCLSAWQHNSGTHDGEAFIMSLDLFQRVISFDRNVCLLNLSALLVRIGPLWSEPQT